MASIKTSDGTELFYKDWGPRTARPVVFHHGWPLSADDWDNQMMFFLSHGYRVIAHDRRGHGRSSQAESGNDMDTYASDVVLLVDTLDLQNAIHVGHSAGGGEVARYVARANPVRVAKAVLISAVTPLMLQTRYNPGGLPMKVFDEFRTALVANRAQFYRDIPAGPFFGFNRAGAKISEGVIQNWWRQAMMGGIKAQYDCIKALSETDFTEDLKAISVSTLVLHGDDDRCATKAIAAAPAGFRRGSGRHRQDDGGQRRRGSASRLLPARGPICRSSAVGRSTACLVRRRLSGRADDPLGEHARRAHGLPAGQADSDRARQLRARHRRGGFPCRADHR